MRRGVHGMSRGSRKTLVIALVTAMVTCFTMGLAVYADSENSSNAGAENKEKSDSEKVYVMQKEDGSPYERIVDNDGSLQYHGFEDCKLPVTMEVTYSLEGEEITPEKLKGKSGHVTIEVEYKSNVTRDGTHVPFVAITGAIFSGDHFSNVHVNSGKVLEDGTNAVAMGFAFPGLKEELGSGLRLLSIPEKVTFQADAREYELGEIYTIVSAQPFREIDLSEVSDAQGLLDKLEELKGAASKLTEGTEALKDGAVKIDSAAQKLSQGSHKLVKGAKAVSDGNKALDRKVPTLTNGIGALADGAKDLSEGAAGLSGGLSQLYGTTDEEGIRALAASAKDLSEGAASLYGEDSSKGTQALAAGAEALSGSAGDLAAGAGDLADGIGELADGLGSAAVELGKLSGNSQSLNQGATAIAGSATSVKDDIDAAISAVNDLEDSPQKTEALQKLNAAKESAEETAESASSYKTSVANYTGGVDAIAQELGETDLESLVKGAEDLSDGLEQLYGASASQGARGLAEGVKTANEGAKALAVGTARLETGISQVNGVLGQQLVPGAAGLSNGAEKVYGGITSLQGGSKTLVQGISKLSTGSLKLYNGTLSFSNYENKLAKGTNKLAKGARTLDSAIDRALAKTKSELERLDAGSMQDLVENARAVNRAAMEYKSFEGKGSYEEVTFIYKMDGSSQK